jgi:hypothetical protein
LAALFTDGSAGVANKISGFLHFRPMISALKMARGGMGAETKRGKK